MSDYANLARRYDALTQDVDYKKRANYIKKQLPRDFHEPVLELGCGTGSLSVELAARGFLVTGIDRSAEMLAVASQKAQKRRCEVTFAQQDITKLELPYNVGLAVAMLDVFNHLPSLRAVKQTFLRLAGYMPKGGLFVFDVNTEYKHRELLGELSYVFEREDFVCVWQNRLHKANARVDIALDLFERRADGTYDRLSERFSEYFYSDEEIQNALETAGFSLLERIDGESYASIAPTTQRILYTAKRK